MFYITSSSPSSSWFLLSPSPEQPVVSQSREVQERTEWLNKAMVLPANMGNQGNQGQQGRVARTLFVIGWALLPHESLRGRARSIAHATWTRTGKDGDLNEQTKVLPCVETNNHQGSRGQTAVDHDSTCFLGSPRLFPLAVGTRAGKPYQTRDPDVPRSRDASLGGAGVRVRVRARGRVIWNSSHHQRRPPCVILPRCWDTDASQSLEVCGDERRGDIGRGIMRRGAALGRRGSPSTQWHPPWLAWAPRLSLLARGQCGLGLEQKGIAPCWLGGLGRTGVVGVSLQRSRSVSVSLAHATRTPHTHPPHTSPTPHNGPGWRSPWLSGGWARLAGRDLG